ncbi:MAG: succinate dehydrogenase, cytochrome b556 subunit [Burkholderiales bacterium]|nr:succinate dehydrogenase, cytochrome b556 subunit [Burkholderiales bacterium]
MKSNRPVYLDLRRIRQPLPAIVSFLHRVSGAFLFLGIPLLLIAFEASLAGPDSFVATLGHPLIKLALFILLAAYFYHFFAGLRFLLLDLGWGVALAQARRASWAVLLAAAVCAATLGAWLW